MSIYPLPLSASLRLYLSCCLASESNKRYVGFCVCARVLLCPPSHPLYLLSFLPNFPRILNHRYAHLRYTRATPYSNLHYPALLFPTLLSPTPHHATPPYHIPYSTNLPSEPATQPAPHTQRKKKTSSTKHLPTYLPPIPPPILPTITYLPKYLPITT